MTLSFLGFDPLDILQFAGSIGQVCTTVLAAGIAVRTFRHGRQQAALNLINGTNALANLVNTTVIQSPEARAALGRLQDPIVGCPDDAVLFMYLNYVHNTFRTWKAGAATSAVWRDTLDSCVAMVARLRRDQLDRLLSRGYEAAFKAEVLAGYDRLPRPERSAARPHLALAA